MHCFPQYKDHSFAHPFFANVDQVKVDELKVLFRKNKRKCFHKKKETLESQDTVSRLILKKWLLLGLLLYQFFCITSMTIKLMSSWPVKSSCLRI